jgi:hypothetical protein
MCDETVLYMLEEFIKIISKNINCYSWKRHPQSDNYPYYIAKVSKTFTIKIFYNEIFLCFKDKIFMKGLHDGKIFSLVKKTEEEQKETMSVSLYNQLRMACEMIHNNNQGD